VKVLFLTPWYPSQVQPVAGVFVREMAHAAHLHDDVAVLHIVGPDRSLATRWQLEEETDPVLTQDIPTYRLRWRPWPVPPRNYFVYMWAVLAAVRLLGRREFEPDIFHAHVYLVSDAAWLAGRVFGKPIVLSEHSSAFARNLLGPLHRLLLPRVFPRLQRVMPVSAALQRDIEAMGIRGRFQVIPNAVDLRRFRAESGLPAADGTKRVLFVGLLDGAQTKGLPNLLLALAQVTRDGIAWHLDVVGDGPGRAACEQMSANLGSAERVTFHGLLDQDAVAALMRRCDFLVLPSWHETFGVVIVEALASGRPVVVTDCGGPAEIVTPELGIIVPPGDIPALAGAVVAMSDHHRDYSYARLARVAADRFGLEAVGEVLDQVYHSVLTGRDADSKFQAKKNLPPESQS
jgi:glycosyltransferase involved in cell wall biosynthesis